MDNHTRSHASSRHARWLAATLLFTLLLLCVFAAVMIYIDPLFHYHAPLEDHAYTLDFQRYQNDGIVRNFSYSGIITGTSMTENFKASEAASLFDAQFVKVPFSGGYYKEIDNVLRRAYRSGNEIRCVIRGLDYTGLIQDKDAFKYYDYPDYLYNDNLFDDVNYVLNKKLFFQRAIPVFENTRAGLETTSFDDYSSWSSANDGIVFGASAILPYAYTEEALGGRSLTEEERALIVGNLRQNVIELALAHPETTFYLFFPPYSICWWDTQEYAGRLTRHFEAEQLAIEELLPVENIRLYSFSSNFDLVCDLDNYKDQGHYGPWVNSMILEWMENGDYLLTQENYLSYLKTIRDFYTSYDYSIYREQADADYAF